MDESSFTSSFRTFRSVPSGAVCALALFLGLELLTRVAWRPDIVGPRIYSHFDPSYNYGFAADTPRLFPRGDIDVYYATEYVNIRPFALRRVKAEKEIRIFTFGGSVSRGSGVPDGADYSSILERLLKQSYPAFDWHVVNLSADGIGSTRIYHFLENVVAYDPDALIVHLHGSNEYEDERDASEQKQLQAGFDGLVLHSHFLVLLRKLQSRFLPLYATAAWNPAEEDRLSGDPANFSRWLATLQNNTERIDCFAVSLNIPAIYVGRAERDAHDFRNDRVERLNAPITSKRLFFDTAAAFARDTAHRPAELFIDNTHFSAAGHGLVARSLLQMVRPGGPVLATTPHGSAHRLRDRRTLTECDNPKQQVTVSVSGSNDAELPATAQR